MKKERRKICLIDDEPDVLEIYGKSLEKNGYEVTTAKNGREGLEIIKKNMPDLILVDIMMPEMNGIELIKALGRDENLSKIPVVVMSNVNDQETCREVGKYDTRFYLVKSLFEPKKVVSIVDEVLHNL